MNYMDTHYMKFATISVTTGTAGALGATFNWPFMFGLISAIVTVSVGSVTIWHLVKQIRKNTMETEILRRKMCSECEGRGNIKHCSVFKADPTACRYSNLFVSKSKARDEDQEMEWRA